MKKLLEGGRIKELKENEGLSRKKRKRTEMESTNGGASRAGGDEAR